MKEAEQAMRLFMLESKNREARNMMWAVASS